MNLRSEFITWYFNEFKNDPLYVAMSAITEDSPWHREGNIGIHTDMVVTQYLARTGNNDNWYSCSKDNGHKFLLGAFACAFHDTGKPPSMEIKQSETRGEYRAFNGHEPVSARMFENWAMANWNMISNRFRFTAMDLHTTSWMIENHLPWGLKDVRKRNNLALSIARNEIYNVFPHVLMADATGRISDDHDSKIFRSTEWVEEMSKLVRQQGLEYFTERRIPKNPMMIIPIAPSGAGKTTLFNGWYPDFAHFSLDALRLVMAEDELDLADVEGDDTRYSIAWGYCNDNKQDFSQFWQKEFMKIMKAGENVFIDGTNLSRRRRTFFVDQGQRRGYHVKAVLLPITFDEAIARQGTRTDKTVPYSSVKNQYYSLQQPWYGEFDEIEVLMN